MFIYHFNRLIRNRILWGAFAFLIAMAFVGVPMLSTRMDRLDRDMLAGTLAGEPVPRDVFGAAHEIERRMLGFESDVDADELAQRTWQRLAALRAAGTLGIQVADRELSRTIQRDPSFQEDGRFDPNLYRALLMRHEMLPETYENFTRQRLVFSKLNDVLNAAVWIAPSELQSQVAGMADEFTVQYAWISNRYAQAEMDLDAETLRRYYAENVESYRIPERSAVRYVALAVSNHLDEVQVALEDLQDFYHSHSDRFRREPGTNGVAEPIPFLEVADSIRDELEYDDARFHAASAAMRFSEKLLRDRGMDAIERHAVAQQLVVHTTGLFHARERLPEIDVEAPFVEAAMDLEPDRADRRISDAVPGRDWVYVLSAWTNAPSEIPAFDSVRERVRAGALREARAEAFERFAGDTRQAAQALLADGQAFDAAMSALGLEASSNLVFSAIESYELGGPPHAHAMARAMVHLRPGSLSQPERSEDGQILVYVHDRQPGDPLTADMLRQQLRAQLEQFRENLLFDDWLRWNLAQMNPDSFLSETRGSVAGVEDVSPVD